MAISKIDSDGIVSGGITADSLNIGQIGGRRNLIINGAMQVAQYGTSTTSDGGKCVDRYRNYQNVGTFTAEQSTDTPVGFSYSLKRTNGTGTSATGANYSLVRYRVEDKDIAHLNFGTNDAIQFTVSFWVKSSVTGTYVLGLCDATEERTYAATYTINSADTWEQKSITLYASTQATWSTTGNVGLSINWDLGSGADRQVTTANEWTTATPSTGGSWTHSSRVDWVGTTGATFYITGVQLEVGTVATPHEHISYGEQLALCQRYFWLLEAGSGERGSVGDGAAYVSSNFTCRIQCPQIMRDNPTMSVSTSSNDIIIYGNASADSTSLNNLALSRAFPYAVVVQMNAGIAVTQGYAYWAELNNTANYKAIKFDAEL